MTNTCINYWSKGIILKKYIAFCTAGYTVLIILHCMCNTYYYSFKIFPCLWLVKNTHIIHHNQLLLTKFWKTFVILNRWCQKVCQEMLSTNDVKMISKVQPTAGYWTVEWENRGTIFGEQKNKEKNGKTPLRMGKYFEWIIKQYCYWIWLS